MFDVRPGITGWAQVNGRKGVEWHKRIELNVWYVDHVSFFLDVKIFFMTIFKVLRNSDNVNSGATVEGTAAETPAEETQTEKTSTAEAPAETVPAEETEPAAAAAPAGE